MTTDGGAPGALVESHDRRGGKVLTCGVADIRSQGPIRAGSAFRIGSRTKVFVATVVLQLVGENRVALDTPVERSLPGVVRGPGGDGRVITVRQLLRHTTGLPDCLAYLSPGEILKDPLAHRDTHDLVDLALAHPPTFHEPGHGWKYSNTNYLLAGMLSERVTGHPYGEEIRGRIITPLGLHATSVPGDSPVIPGVRPQGYARPAEGALLRAAPFCLPGDDELRARVQRGHTADRRCGRGP